uniref:Uncharacterized protein n=1 Tax=Oryza nivara TaxID=4536 RepID=A0A0E0J9S9_ORYNI
MEFIYGWVVDSNVCDERTYGLVWVLETGGVAERLMMNVVFFMGDGDLVVLVVGKIALVLSNMLYEDMKAGPDRVLIIYDQTSYTMTCKSLENKQCIIVTFYPAQICLL